MEDIYVLIFINLICLLYYLISYFNVRKKTKSILNSQKIFDSQKRTRFFNSYVDKIESKLFNLQYPYKLNAKKYLIIKYVFSVIFGIIAFLNYKNIVISIIFVLVIFFIPNYLLFNFKNNEKYILINEIKNLTESIILNLSAYCTLEQSLIKSKSVLEYERFKIAYDKFIYEYKMNGFDIKKAAFNLEARFVSYELSLFITSLIQGDVEGNLLETLKKFSETLQLNYFKYLKKKSSKRLLYVTFGTVLSLINIVLVVMYPMFKQVIDNLEIMFV